jgi:hypothetical protein
MAQKGWPFENIDTSETEFSLWARNIGEGVINDKGLELEPYADGSGMNVKVKTGQVLIRGHYYENTTEVTLTIAVADPSLPRIDRVVLRLDPSANTVALAVLTGTPNASPSAPALTQSESAVYELPLATVAVSAAAVVISAGNVTSERLIFTSWSAATQASIDTAIAGKQNTITGAATSITTSNLTASRALASDGSGKVAASSVTSTELGYVSGVTSALQTQLNAKVGTVNGTVTTAATGSTVVRNITLSTSDPSGGTDGQVWLKYTP